MRLDFVQSKVGFTGDLASKRAKVAFGTGDFPMAMYRMGDCPRMDWTKSSAVVRPWITRSISRPIQSLSCRTNAIVGEHANGAGRQEPVLTGGRNVGALLV